jgi:thioester reductase-like protein
MKVKYVEGDIAKEGLGLSIKHRQTLMTSRVSLVFHIAASVSFQETLLQTIKTNILPVIELVRLCQAMPDIKVM